MRPTHHQIPQQAAFDGADKQGRNHACSLAAMGCKPILEWKYMNEFVFAAIAAFILAALMVLGTMDKQDADADEANYCAMVKLHHESNGNQGWPPYQGEDFCNTKGE